MKMQYLLFRRPSGQPVLPIEFLPAGLARKSLDARLATTKCVLLLLWLVSISYASTAFGVSIELITRAAPLDTASGTAYEELTSDDGRYAYFISRAPDLVAGVIETTDSQDVFLFDRDEHSVRLVSHMDDSPHQPSNGDSWAGAASPDGRWLIYARTPHPVGALGNKTRVLLYDRSNNATTLVSRSSAMATSAANGDSYPVAVSNDGNGVLWVSLGTDVIAGGVDQNSDFDVFLFNRTTGANRLVSQALAMPGVSADRASSYASMSADGRWVVFASRASNLVGGITDPAGRMDVFLFDRQSETITQVTRSLASPSAAPNGESHNNALSADGRWIAFESFASNMVNAVDANNQNDIFMYDTVTGSTVLVSRAQNSATQTPNNESSIVDISNDGRYVVYRSKATNIVPGVTDSNNTDDVFLFDRVSQATTLLSKAFGTATTSNRMTYRARVSDDGRWVMLDSESTNLVPGIAPEHYAGSNVFLIDRSNGSIALLSHSRGDGPVSAVSGTSSDLSADGRWVTMVSYSSELVPGLRDQPDSPDVYQLDRQSASVELITRAIGLEFAGGRCIDSIVSADGNWVYFTGLAHPSEPTPAVGGAHLYVLNRTSREIRLLSRPLDNANTNSSTGLTAVSPDGRWSLFSSSHMLVAGVTDNNTWNDIFLHDRVEAVTTLVSRAAGGTATGNSESTAVAVSPDGRWVLFNSRATDLVSGISDSNGGEDVFLMDRTTGTTRLVSRSSGSASVTGNLWSTATAMSSDGRWILYRSKATDLVAGIADANGVSNDAFLFDRLSGTTSLVSRADGMTTTGDRSSEPLAMSADGRHIVFSSLASNIIANAAAGSTSGSNLYLFDRTDGSKRLISRSAANPDVAANNDSSEASITPDGRWIQFVSRASDLVSGIADTRQNNDVFLFDANSNVITPVSKAARTESMGDNWSSLGTMSDDGRWIAFGSFSSDLVAGVVDLSGEFDLFLFDRSTGKSSLISRVHGQPLVPAGAHWAISIDAQGYAMSFRSEAPDLVAGVIDIGDSYDLFLASNDLFTDGFESTPD